MQKNLRIRAKVNSAIRKAMEKQGFVEIETPMLIASTPEGRETSLFPLGSIRRTSMLCHKAHKSLNNYAWSGVLIDITKLPVV